jgi:hypothetical protein
VTSRGGGRPRRRAFDTVFALVHLGVVAAALAFGVYSLAIGATVRGVYFLAALAVYYVLVLHGAVRKEIARKRGRG